ncbi:MAG: DUF4091 domain-containing protein [Clostridiales bacterium]|nr:DUF4091 domain-containing protein [Clostridiales bacterium]
MNIKYTLKPALFKLNSNYSVDDCTNKLSAVALRNDSTALQLIVTSDEPFALLTGRSNWFSKDNPMAALRISADCNFDVKLNIVDMHTGDGGEVKYADALLSTDTLEIPADTPTAVYIEAAIPASAEAGSYPLKLRLFGGKLFEDERLLGEACAEIEVLDYILHDTKFNKFHLDLWQHLSNIARKAEVPLWSDEHFTVIEGYVRSLGELGQKAVTLIVTDAPWAGQGCFREKEFPGNLFEYSIVPVCRNADGSFEYDYSIMQRYIDLCAAYGIDRELSVYGICGTWKAEDEGFGRLAPDYPDALRIRYLDRADGCYKYMRTAAEIDGYIAALEQYFVTTGQIDRVRIAADEPADIEAYRAILAHLGEIAPEFRFKAAINHPEFVSEFGEEVYDFAPSYGSLCTKFNELDNYRRTMKGKRFLYYICCGPSFPNNFLDSDLTESLYLGVMASYAQFDGLLRWSYTVWNDDPRADLRYGSWRAGDTCLVYPQKNGRPLLTLRWKALKRAITIYELLETLRAADAQWLNHAFGLVMRERDITKCASVPLDELCSTDPADYDALIRFVTDKLIRGYKKA